MTHLILFVARLAIIIKPKTVGELPIIIIRCKYPESAKVSDTMPTIGINVTWMLLIHEITDGDWHNRRTV